MKNVFGVRYHWLDKFKSLRSDKELIGNQIPHTEVNVSLSVKSGATWDYRPDESLTRLRDVYNIAPPMNDQIFKNHKNSVN